MTRLLFVAIIAPSQADDKRRLWMAGGGCGGALSSAVKAPLVGDAIACWHAQLSLTRPANLYLLQLMKFDC